MNDGKAGRWRARRRKPVVVSHAGITGALPAAMGNATAADSRGEGWAMVDSQ
jgi:hypothetical protein